MSNGHTPGPWATYRDQLSVGETHGHSGICEVWERHGGQGFENARLIAAAPDLLKACEALVAYDDMIEEDDGKLMMHYADLVRLSRAAIAKARGTPC